MQAGKVALGVLAVLVAAVLFALWRRPADPEPALALTAAERAEPPVASAPAERNAADRLSVSGDEAARDHVPGAAPDAPVAQPSAPAAASARVQGIVVDPRGAPLAGVPVGRAGSEETLAWSTPDGAFEVELALASLPCELATVGGGIATVRSSRVRRTSLGERHPIVAAPAIDLAGIVVDEAGVGRGKARVVVSVPDEALRGLPWPLDTTSAAQRAVSTAADGRFELPAVPSVSGALVQCEEKGYEPASAPVPRESASDLVLVLRARAADAPSLTGVVFHQDGSLAEGAAVHLGAASAKTDDAGRFRLALEEWIDPSSALVAVKKGFQPAVKLEFGRLLADGALAPAPVSLFLDGPVLQIRGRVVEHDGAPCARWNVDLVDPTPITQNRVPAVTAEALSAARSAGSAKTDGGGAFAIDGLAERSYTLRAWSPESFASLVSEPIAAGRVDVELRLPADLLIAALRGRVVSPNGAPIAGASVSVRFVLARSGGAQSFDDGDPALTDAEGRFELPRVPRRGVSLTVAGETVVPIERAIEELDLERECELVARRRCHFRVVAAKPAEDGPDSFELLGEDGRAEQVHLFRAFGSGSSSRRPLEHGESPVLAAGEGRYELVFYREGREHSRLPIELVPGDVQVLGDR